MNLCVINDAMLERIWFFHFMLNLSMAALLCPYQTLVKETHGLEKYLYGYQNILIVLGILFSISFFLTPKFLQYRLFKNRLTICNDNYLQKFHTLTLSTYLFQWALLEIITLIGIIYVNIVPTQLGFAIFLSFFSFSVFFSFIRRPITS